MVADKQSRLSFCSAPFGGDAARVAPCATLALLASTLVGCAGGTQQAGRDDPVRVVAQRDIQPPLKVKPAGVVVTSDRPSMGPPPPGHPRIVGEPVPDWDPLRMEPRSNPLSWVSIGPGPISSEAWSGDLNASGRVVSIAPHPTDANTVYIGTASGGVWKTINGGTTWSPLTDALSTTNMGAVALDPTNPNIVYAGTGEYWTDSQGDGVFRSTDGGGSWTRIATAAQVGNQITAIEVDHTNTQIIHVAGSNGCYRSTDGGATWTRRQSGSISGMVIDRSNPQILYLGINGQGVFKSVNGGNTYTRLAGGLPTSGLGVIVLDISRSNPSVLYAGVVSSGGTASLYRTSNAGSAWTQKTATPNFCSPQCWYDLYVKVDPANENTVYCGGVDPRYATSGIIKSTNGGDSWTETSQNPGGAVHPDHHAMAFGPGGVIWEGNDGGVWKSTTGAASWVNCNTNLAASQIYQIVQHPTSVERYLAGTQDNGTPERTGASMNWPQLQAGDGGFSAYDFRNTTRRYTTYVYLSLYRWNNASGSTITGPWTSDSTNWISPILIDPNTATTLYAGTSRLWRSTNATSSPPTWTAISTSAISGNSTLNCISIPKINSSVIYTGSSNGQVWTSSDAGANWTNRSAGLPGGEISDVIVNDGNANELYVSCYNGSGSRVVRSTNGGATWTSVGSTLPAGVVPRALAVDFSTTPDTLYVGSGAGVYVSLNGGATWVKNDATLPNVNIGDLLIDSNRRWIVAGTYGRGAWRASLPVPCPADFNLDGFLDGFDYDDFVACFEGAGCPAGRTADFNGDGFADGFDYDDFVTAFELGCN